MSKISGGYSAATRYLSHAFLIIVLGGLVTWLGYFLLMNLAYYPGHYIDAGAGSFLLPRYWLQQNDMVTTVFSSWPKFLIHGSVSALILLFSYYVLYKKARSRPLFLLGIYLSALAMEINFLGFTPNGLSHIGIQVASINDGLWRAQEILQTRYDFTSSHVVGKLKYIYRVLGSNNTSFTMFGGTHPPGVYVMTYFILWKISHLFESAATAWGVLITLINTFLVLIISQISKLSFSERQSRQLSLFFLTIPSLCFNFCVMLDVFASLFVGIGLLFAVMACHEMRLNNLPNRRRFFLLGIGSGFGLTCAAQFTYGHAMVVLAIIGAFAFVHPFVDRKRTGPFWAGLVSIALIYFIFEIWISAGTAFWPVRAFKMAKYVEDGLQARPYPLSQFANWIVMFVTGGIIFLPATLLALRPFSKLRIEKRFIYCVVIGILIFLIPQKTVRLEVERTWHWAFVPVWAMGGLFCVAVQSTVRRLFPGLSLRGSRGLLPLLTIQLCITVAMAMCIQDYY